MIVPEFWPYPELFIYPYLANLGWLPYRQIIDHHSPGLVFFPLNLASGGLTTPAAMQVALLLIVLVQAVLIYRISCSKLVVTWYVIWQSFFGGNYLWYDSFLGLFVLPAYLAWRARRWLVAGLLLGSAVVVKQSILPLGVFVAGLTWWTTRRLRPVMVFTLGAMTPPLLTAIYFWRLGVFWDFWYWVVTFNWQVYAAAGRLAPAAGDLRLLLLPVILLAVAVPRLRDKSLLGWLVFSVVSGLSRFALVHLQPAVPFMALILVSLPRRVVAMALVASLLWVGGYYWRSGNFGQVRFFDAQTLRLVEMIKERTRLGEKIFLLGTQPNVYVLTQTVPAGNIFAFHMPWILSVVEDRILSGLKSDPPNLVVWDTQSSVDGISITASAPKLVQYISDNYQAIATVGSNLIYARRN